MQTSSKKKPGRPTGWRKNKPAAPLEDAGNPDFNLNDAEPIGLTDADLAPPAPPTNVDFAEIDRKRFAKPMQITHERASSALTQEDIAFEMELQSMSRENEMPAHIEQTNVTELKKERPDNQMLSDLMPETKPAQSLNELDNQVFLAKSLECDAIEADEKIIRYFTRNSYPTDVGYFMYKDVKVFIPGRFKETVNTDRGNMYSKVYLTPKVEVK